MTRDKDFKQLVRARMRATGESYTTARAALVRQKAEGAMVRVTCGVRVQKLTAEQAERRVATLASFQMEAAEGETTEGAITRLRQNADDQPWLILSEVEGDRVLRLACGPVEATAVVFALQGIKTARPMTHDLLADVVSAMGEAREVRITELRETTYFAELLVIDSGGQERVVSCRPSDGIALAVRSGMPIFVEPSLMFERKAEGA